MSDECKKLILENIIYELNEIDNILYYVELKNNINPIYEKEIRGIKNKLGRLLSDLNELVEMNRFDEFFRGGNEKCQ